MATLARVSTGLDGQQSATVRWIRISGRIFEQHAELAGCADPDWGAVLASRWLESNHTAVGKFLTLGVQAMLSVKPHCHSQHLVRSERCPIWLPERSNLTNSKLY